MFVHSAADFAMVEQNHAICLVELAGDDSGVLWLVDVAGHVGSVQPIRVQLEEDSGVSETVSYGVHSRRIRRGFFGVARIPGIEEWSQKRGPAGYYLQVQKIWGRVYDESALCFVT